MIMWSCWAIYAPTGVAEKYFGNTSENTCYPLQRAEASGMPSPHTFSSEVNEFPAGLDLGLCCYILLFSNKEALPVSHTEQDMA